MTSMISGSMYWYSLRVDVQLVIEAIDTTIRQKPMNRTRLYWREVTMECYNSKEPYRTHCGDSIKP